MTARQRRCRGQAAQETGAGQQLLQVMVGREIVRLDLRRLPGIGRFDPDLAPARRTAGRRAEGEARKGIGLQQGPRAGRDLLIGQRAEIELHIGAGEIRAGAEEAAALIDAEGKGPAPRQHIAQPCPQPARPVVELVVQARHPAAIDIVVTEVVLEILPDCLALMPHLDAAGFQQRGGTDTGELQQLRGIDRAAAEDDLRPGAGLAALARAAHRRRRRRACPRTGFGSPARRSRSADWAGSRAGQR